MTIPPQRVQNGGSTVLRWHVSQSTRHEQVTLDPKNLKLFVPDYPVRAAWVGWVSLGLGPPSTVP